MLNFSKKVAITGGLSCGKSSVCRFFKQLGAHVVSADEIVHHLLSPDTDLGRKIIQLLGSDVLNDNLQFDREKITKKVFKDSKLLQAYEKLLHPAVREETERQYQIVKNGPKPQLFVAEIPLLFETGAESLYDVTIAVVADPNLCKARFAEAKGYDQEEYERRMQRQMPLEEKASKATYVIHNNGTLDELKKNVESLYNQIIH